MTLDPLCLFAMDSALYAPMHVLVNDECNMPRCKVEFNQPSYWLYSVPNLLVFQQLVTLYFDGILVRVVSEIV